MDCQITRGGGATGWKRGGSDGETMVSAKCSPSPSPSSVVSPDVDNHDLSPSRGGDARLHSTQKKLRDVSHAR